MAMAEPSWQAEMQPAMPAPIPPSAAAEANPVNQPPAPSPQAVAETPPKQGAGGEDSSEVKQKLEQLKILRKNSLITEEEYTAKKMTILEKI